MTRGRGQSLIAGLPGCRNRCKRNSRHPAVLEHRTLATSADTSTNATPNGANTPTGSVVVPGRDRSGTIIARPVCDQATVTVRWTHRSWLAVPDTSAGPSTWMSAANSRPETKAEDDGNVDMDTSCDDGVTPPSLERQQHTDTGTVRATYSRRAVGIVSDAAPVAVVTPGLTSPLTRTSSTMRA